MKKDWGKTFLLQLPFMHLRTSQKSHGKSIAFNKAT